MVLAMCLWTFCHTVWECCLIYWSKMSQSWDPVTARPWNIISILLILSYNSLIPGALWIEACHITSISTETFHHRISISWYPGIYLHDLFQVTSLQREYQSQAHTLESAFSLCTAKSWMLSSSLRPIKAFLHNTNEAVGSTHKARAGEGQRHVLC